MKYGKAILLNGASCSGKTSRAKDLQSIMDDVYYYVSIDGFCCWAPDYLFTDDPWMYCTDIPYPNLPNPKLEEDKFSKLMDSFPKIVSGFHNSIEALIRTGNNVIIDHVLQRKEWTIELVKLLCTYDVYLIGLFCNPEELENRQRLRGGPSGMSEYQSQLVHRGMKYDLEIDTEKLNIKESALEIKGLIESNSHPCAINQVYKELILTSKGI